MSGNCKGASQVFAAAVYIVASLAALPACKKRQPQRNSLALSVVRHDENTESWMARCEQEFEAAHPDIDLVVSVLDADDLLRALSGPAPSSIPAADVAIVPDAAVAEYAARGELLHPSDYYPAYAGEFLDLAIRMATYSGAPVAVPVGLSVYGLYYNRGLLQAAGKPPPHTWAELLDAARATTRPGEGVYGLSLQTTGAEAAALWYAFTSSAGGEVVTADGEWAGSTQEALKALRFLADLVADESITDPADIGASAEAIWDKFANGEAAMTVAPTEARRQIEGTAEPIEYGVAAVPGDPSAVSLATAEHLVVFADTSHRQAAAAFVAFFFEDRRHLDWAKTFSVLPTKRSVAEPAREPQPANAEEALLEAVPLREDPSWKQHFDLLQVARFVPFCPNRREMDEIVGDTLFEVYSGTKSPQEAVAEMEASLGARLGGDAATSPADPVRFRS